MNHNVLFDMIYFHVRFIWILLLHGLLGAFVHHCYGYSYNCFRVIAPFTTRTNRDQAYRYHHHHRPNTWVSESSQSDNINDDTVVQVYDNVFDSKTLYELHQLATDHSDRIGDDSTIFYRNASNLTPLESAIDIILTNVLHDAVTTTTIAAAAAPIVEYWSRQEYINIDTHCDLDEYLLINRKMIKCPKYAHILYLYMKPSSLPNSTLIAPTCIFPSKQEGWASIDNSETDNVPPSSTSTTDVVVIPAVPGRVIRFPGNAMHAVPKPPTKWFLTREEQEEIDNYDDHDDDGDDDDDSDTTTTQNHRILRSVLLFNCWSNSDDASPIGLKTYNEYVNCNTVDIVPDGIRIDEDENHSDKCTEVSTIGPLSIQETKDNATIFQLNEHRYKTKIVSKTMYDGVQVNSNSNNTTESRSSLVTLLRIPLMGKKMRRKYDKSVAQLIVDDADALRQALQEPYIPSCIHLSNESQN